MEVNKINWLTTNDLIRDLKDVNASTVLKWVSRRVIKGVIHSSNPVIQINSKAYNKWKVKEYPALLEKYNKRLASRKDHMAPIPDLRRKCYAITGIRTDGSMIQIWVYSKLSISASVREVTELLESPECLELVKKIERRRVFELKRRKDLVKFNTYIIGTRRPCGVHIKNKEQSRCKDGVKGCSHYMNCLEYATSRGWQGWVEVRNIA